MKTDLFQSCGHCWVFQICWHVECSTFTASSFRIWNSQLEFHHLHLVYIGITKSLFLFTKKRAEYRWFKQQSNSSKGVRRWKYLQEPEPGPGLHVAVLQGLPGQVLLQQPRGIWRPAKCGGIPPAPPQGATRSDWELRPHTCRLHLGRLRHEDIQDTSQRQVAKVRTGTETPSEILISQGPWSTACNWTHSEWPSLLSSNGDSHPHRWSDIYQAKYSRWP